jgi:surface protein
MQLGPSMVPDCLASIRDSSPGSERFHERKEKKMKKLCGIIGLIFLISLWSVNALPFSATWDTTKAGSANNIIVLPITGTYFVEWGDGTNDTTVNNHTYASPGTYTINITNIAETGFSFNNGGDRLKIININQWGDLYVGNSGGYFYGCENLNSTAIDNLDLTSTTTLTNMFRGTALKPTIFNGNISGWNTSNIIDTSYMFSYATFFNQDIGSWDVSKANNTEGMFYGDTNFNQDISSWDVSQVINMRNMFFDAEDFNQDISAWNTGKVTDMSGMFQRAIAFNQSIGSWNVGNVTTMNGMFRALYNKMTFNQNLSAWDTRKVTNMVGMFGQSNNGDYQSFNGDISRWNTSSVITMEHMFMFNKAFNQDISSWDVGDVQIFTQTFRGASLFNQDISGWDTHSVTSFNQMFYNDTGMSFNQNLGNWNISSLTSAIFMFKDNALSTTNYDYLLMGWACQNLHSAVTFDGGNSKYSYGGLVGRLVLNSTYNWSMTDGGLDPAAPNTTFGCYGSPVMLQSSITPTTAYANTTTLYGFCNGSDINNDTLTYYYDWLLNGTHYNITQNLSTTFRYGQTWNLKCTANDGILNSTPLTSSPLAITNTPPYITSSSISPLIAHTKSIIIGNCTGGDADQGALSYIYQWYINDVPDVMTNNLTGVIKGSNVTLGCAATDGMLNSTWLNSSIITILNTAPNMTAIIISPLPALSNSTLNCSPTTNDDDNDSLTYDYNWTINGADPAVHTQTLDPGNFSSGDKVICYAKAYDGTDYSNWMTSSEVTINDVIPPTITNWSVSSSNPYFDESTIISVDCFDADSSISTDYPRVTFINTNDLTFYNFSMSHINGTTYNKPFTFTQIGVPYSNFTFYCLDTSGNMQTNYTILSVTPKARTTPGGGGGGGGERQVFLTTNASAVCGDKICSEGEDPLSCSEDCRINFDSLFTCLFQNAQQSCNWDQAWFPTALLVFVFVIIIISAVYRRRNRKY